MYKYIYGRHQKTIADILETHTWIHYYANIGTIEEKMNDGCCRYLFTFRNAIVQRFKKTLVTCIELFS